MSSAPRPISPEPVPAAHNCSSSRPQNPAPSLATAHCVPTPNVYILPRAGNPDLSGTPHSLALIPAMPQQCNIIPETAGDVNSSLISSNVNVHNSIAGAEIPSSFLGNVDPTVYNPGSRLFNDFNFRDFVLETGIVSGPVINNNSHLSDSRIPESDLGPGLAPNNNNALSLEPQTGSTNKRKKMSELSEEEKEIRREKNRLYKRNQRARQSAARAGEIREENRVAHVEQRQSLTQERIEEIRETDRVAHVEQRENLTQERLEEIRESDRVAHVEQRENLTQERVEEIRESDRVAHVEQRNSQTQERTEEIRESDRLGHREQRENLTQERREEIREENRLAHVSQRSNLTEDERDVISAGRAERNFLLRTAPARFTNLAFRYDPSEDLGHLGNISKMTRTCPHCAAKLFENDPATFCCSGGKVRLSLIDCPPEPLKTLMAGETRDSKDFMENIRRYNSAFSMTSMGVKSIAGARGFNPVFRVQGQVYHRAGSVYTDASPQFAQIYFVGDTADQVSLRQWAGSSVPTLAVLQEMLLDKNELIRQIRSASSALTSPEMQISICADRVPNGEHPRRYNDRVSDDVGLVMVGDSFPSRDIVFTYKDDRVRRITELHRSYDALQYPLILWRGSDGYHLDIDLLDPQTGLSARSGKKVSARQFYSYHLQVRAGWCHLLMCRRLLQVYLVDMFAKIESEKLLYIKNHQVELRAGEYELLSDALNNHDLDPAHLGRSIILPSTFTGSPRFWKERVQNAMCYVRKSGKPDLFITFTCNPAWPEISENLFPRQTPYDRHDVVARVFKHKLDRMLTLLTSPAGGVFGLCKAFMYTVEWQKRGLPHAHILLWLHNKIRPSQIDSVIRAEIPDQNLDPELFELVTSQMVHGPCGDVNPDCACMKDGRCTKNFPKEFIQATRTDLTGYPLYRRLSPQDGGAVAQIRRAGRVSMIDNRNVVPYSPALLKAVRAHVNVELCCSVQSIIYIVKYLAKGSDAAVCEISEGDQYNEVGEYVSGRYLNSNEAAWRIFRYPIHVAKPEVVPLDVHLENGHRIYFRAGRLQESVLANRTTKLLEFFKLCSRDPFARTLLYLEIPNYYRYVGKKWIRRCNGKFVENYSRMYVIPPTQIECFSLRLLLTVVVGPTSFDDLRQFEGIVYLTFRDACLARGLLENDRHLEKALEECAGSRSPYLVIDLFALILTHCNPSRPLHLFDVFKDKMVLHLDRTVAAPFSDQDYANLTYLIGDILGRLYKKSLTDVGLVNPVLGRGTYNRNFLNNYDFNLVEFFNNNFSKLNDCQLRVFNLVFDSINNINSGRLFFLDAPGGTGKTFLTNLILMKNLIDGGKNLAVASSGIASTLLHDGRTVHSVFRLPFDFSIDTFTTSITYSSNHWGRIAAANLLVWDEISMAHKSDWEAVDKTLREIKNCDLPFGGVTVLLIGDFRQILPVVVDGTKADQLTRSVKSSALWSRFVSVSLEVNMRAQLAGSSAIYEFSRYLLAIGEGRGMSRSEEVVTLSFGQSTPTLAALEDVIYPFGRILDYNDYLFKNIILSPLNEVVNSINCSVLGKLDGPSSIFYGVDSPESEEELIHFPLEFLNSIEPSGIPPYKLELKVGAPIILLRNLQPPKLCNGTRMVVDSLSRNLIGARILGGKFKGELVFIPRLKLRNSKPVPFSRLQFPVRLCFAMTINKSQGQTFSRLGLALKEEVFTHGQLYVALSRVGDPSNIYYCTEEGSRATNIVFKEIFASSL